MTWYRVLFLFFAVLGVWLNNRKDRRCFYCWLLTNAGWAAVNATHGLYDEAGQNAIFFALAIDGLRKWKTPLTIEQIEKIITRHMRTPRVFRTWARAAAKEIVKG